MVVAYMLTKLLAFVECLLTAGLGTWVVVRAGARRCRQVISMTGLDVVLELARCPEPERTPFFLACKRFVGWILVAALVSFEVLVSHVAGSASLVVADEGPLARVAADMLGKLGCFGVALAASLVRAAVSVWDVARSGLRRFQQWLVRQLRSGRLRAASADIQGHGLLQDALKDIEMAILEPDRGAQQAEWVDDGVRIGEEVSPRVKRTLRAVLFFFPRSGKALNFEASTCASCGPCFCRCSTRQGATLDRSFFDAEPALSPQPRALAIRLSLHTSPHVASRNLGWKSRLTMARSHQQPAASH